MVWVIGCYWVGALALLRGAWIVINSDIGGSELRLVTAVMLAGNGLLLMAASWFVYKYFKLEKKKEEVRRNG